MLLRLGARAAFVVAWLAITALALMPAPSVPVSTLWDKTDHLLAFSVLTLLGRISFTLAPARLGLALLAYGAAIELIQSALPTRAGSLLDLVADALGIALAFGLIALWQARAPRNVVDRA
jgi:VanZ family protein